MSRLREEARRVPTAGWIIAVAVYAGFALLFRTLVWGDLARDGWALWPRALVTFLVPLPLAVYALLISYICADAKRRQMHSVLWTLLAIFVPSGIGIILYFLLREPMPGFCTACGAPVRAGFVFCPRCGAPLGAACPQCRRAVQPDWTVCAWCGAPLQGSPRTPAAQRN